MGEKIKAGDTVTAYGYDWEILDPEYEGKDGLGILCLTRGIIRCTAFSEDGCNNYADSKIKKYLDEAVTPVLERQGAEVRTTELDLTADDGTGWDKEPLEVKGAFLLTEELYRKYRRYISNKEGWWWTATAYSFDCFNSNYTRYVGTDGSLNRYSGMNAHGGLVPACIFSCLPEQRPKDLAEEIMELKKRVAELEERIKNEEVEKIREKCIKYLKGSMELVLFDPSTGEVITPDRLNEGNRMTYEAIKRATELLRDCK